MLPPNNLPINPPPPPATLFHRLAEADFKLDSDSDLTDDLDVESANMTSQVIFNWFLADAHRKLVGIINIQGCIPGNKVRYGGSTLNGKCARHTQYLDKAKKRQMDKQLQAMKQRAVQDQKKHTIIDFFGSKWSNPPPSPVPCTINPSDNT